jgi:hypothetical protein
MNNHSGGAKDKKQEEQPGTKTSCEEEAILSS